MNKKTMAIIVAAIVGLPMVAAASTIENQNVVTGHTVYANMGGFDESIAAIAGLVESKVVWFNGQPIMNTRSDGFVYAVESGAPCSPLDLNNEELKFEGYSLSYVDPNEESHIVAHYSFVCPEGSILSDTEHFLASQFGNQTYHTWVTPTHAKTPDGPLDYGPNAEQGTDRGRWYNFALAVDTDFFRQYEDDSVEHDGTGGRTTDQVNRGNSYCEDDGQNGDHVCNEGNIEGEDTPHTHRSAEVDLFFSTTDKGAGAQTDDANTTHLGTVAGCSLDAHCNEVMTNSTYSDPTSS